MTSPFSTPQSASRAVLIEALGVLGAYHSQLVVIGGWVPDLQLPGKGHLGSIDVDLAVDTRSLPQGPYATILKRLTEAGYRQGHLSNVFLRDVPGIRAPVAVKLDLVAGQYAGASQPQSIQRVQEMVVGTLRGVDLALDLWDEIKIEGERPDGLADTVRARAATLEGLICMKAFALAERDNPKDAYDVYFCLKNGDLDGIADRLKMLASLPLVGEAIRHLNDKFLTIAHRGPTAAAEMANESGEDFEQARRASFELTRYLVERVGVR